MGKLLFGIILGMALTLRTAIYLSSTKRSTTSMTRACLGLSALILLLVRVGGFHSTALGSGLPLDGPKGSVERSRTRAHGPTHLSSAAGFDIGQWLRGLFMPEATPSAKQER